MRHIPRFWFYKLSWVAYLLLTYLAKIIMKLLSHDKVFPVSYFPDFILRSTTVGLVNIDMVPIYHTYVQSLQHIYLSIVED